MIAFPSSVRVWLAAGRTDMRRGMNGLALQVQEALGRDPHLCVDLDYVAEPPRRPGEPAKSGFLRHITTCASHADAGSACAALQEGQDAGVLFFVS
jgi:transposase